MRLMRREICNFHFQSFKAPWGPNEPMASLKYNHGFEKSTNEALRRRIQTHPDLIQSLVATNTLARSVRAVGTRGLRLNLELPVPYFHIASGSNTGGHSVPPMSRRNSVVKSVSKRRRIL
jgi:hypothetical protein